MNVFMLNIFWLLDLDFISKLRLLFLYFKCVKNVNNVQLYNFTTYRLVRGKTDRSNHFSVLITHILWLLNNKSCLALFGLWKIYGCTPTPPDQLPCTYKWLVLSENTSMAVQKWLNAVINTAADTIVPFLTVCRCCCYCLVFSLKHLFTGLTFAIINQPISYIARLETAGVVKVLLK